MYKRTSLEISFFISLKSYPWHVTIYNVFMYVNVYYILRVYVDLYCAIFCMNVIICWIKSNQNRLHLWFIKIIISKGNLFFCFHLRIFYETFMFRRSKLTFLLVKITHSITTLQTSLIQKIKRSVEYSNHLLIICLDLSLHHPFRWTLHKWFPPPPGIPLGLGTLDPLDNLKQRPKHTHGTQNHLNQWPDLDFGMSEKGLQKPFFCPATRATDYWVCGW